MAEYSVRIGAWRITAERWRRKPERAPRERREAFGNPAGCWQTLGARCEAAEVEASRLRAAHSLSETSAISRTGGAGPGPIG